MSTPVVRISGVSKAFLKRKQRVQALDAVDLEVQRGEIVTLLGHNGAGKTTLLKILATLVTPDQGEAEINACSIRKGHQVRRQIGWLATEERSFYWRLTGRQNLSFFAALLNLPQKQTRERIDAVSHQLGLESYIDRRFDRYSAGMRQKLALARALLHEPSVLLLDEPTRSIDLESKDRLRQTLESLTSDQSHTVIMVTHEHAFARSLSHRLVIMNQGRIEKIDESGSTPNTGPTANYTLTTSLLSETERSQFASLPGVSRVEQHPAEQRSTMVTCDLDGTLPGIVQRGIHIIDIHRHAEETS